MTETCQSPIFQKDKHMYKSNLYVTLLHVNCIHNISHIRVPIWKQRHERAWTRQFIQIFYAKARIKRTLCKNNAHGLQLSDTSMYFALNCLLTFLRQYTFCQFQVFWGSISTTAFLIKDVMLKYMFLISPITSSFISHACLRYGEGHFKKLVLNHQVQLHSAFKC